MRKEVQYLGESIGEILWEPDSYGVQVSLDCAIPGDPLLLLRCYGETDTKPFLIGLPEPLHGRLKLKRHLSRETLKEADCLEKPPIAFYLSENGALPSVSMQQPISEEPVSEPSVPIEPSETGSKLPVQTEPSETISEPTVQTEQKVSISSELSDPVPSEMPLYTGDDILDSLLKRGDITGTVCGEKIILRCPFLSDQPFALAPAFVLCAVRRGEAILHWHTKTENQTHSTTEQP